MGVAVVVEVARTMSRFLKYIGLTGGVNVGAGPVQRVVQCWSMSLMWSSVRTVSRTWTGCCITGACRGQNWYWLLGHIESSECGD